MQFFNSIILCFSLFLTGQLYAQHTKQARVLNLEGVITSSSIRPLQKALDEWIVSGDQSPVSIIINSPGGEVFAGMRFVTSMLNARINGIHIDCYVTGMAASMAFQTLTQCSSRYALNTSFLLWHGVRMQTDQPITARLAGALSEDMARLDELIVSQLRDTLKIEDDVILKHFDSETLWSGYSLSKAAPKFMAVSPAFADLQEMKRNAVSTGTSGFLDLEGNHEDYILTHIWKRYAPLLRMQNN